MGACNGKEAASGSPEEQQANKDIEEMLRKEKRKKQREDKILFLGAGEGGKSTIIKQLKFLHTKGGFTAKDKALYKAVVFSNVVESLKVLCLACQLLELPLPENSDWMKDLPTDQPLTQDIAPTLNQLWKNESIQTAFKRSSELPVGDNIQHFLDDIDRLCDPSYDPTAKDIFLCRARTTGVVEYSFPFKDEYVHIIDVGGQRGERRKWVHCFQNVSAVIFVCAVSEFNQVLRENRNVNRMDESLALFTDICKVPWFYNTSIIVFLNKCDLFEQKLKTVGLQSHFPDYQGSTDLKDGLKFMQGKFQKIWDNNQEKNSRRHIYFHNTTATDTEMMKVVFEAVNQIALSQNLGTSGLA